MLFCCLLFSIVSDEKSESFESFVVPLFVTCCFSMSTFNISFSSSLIIWGGFSSNLSLLMFIEIFESVNLHLL